jgi:hypothetical protein
MSVLFRSWPLHLFPFLLAYAASPVRAQEEVIPIVHGEAREGDQPLPGVMVTLHQVSAEMSGEIDSVRAGPNGTFQLRLPRVPAHGERSDVYFASVRHKDILYFGSAIISPAQLDSLYLIQTYDTVSVPPGGATLPLAVRSLFLSKVQEGWEATDFFQIRQDGDRTLFSPEEGMTWHYPLPPEGTDFQVGQGEMGEDAIRFQDGEVALFAPIPPGDRFLLINYRIPDNDFRIPLPGETGRMEVLVRTPAPEAEFEPLAASTPVQMDRGNVFDRWVGEDLEDAEIRAHVRAAPFQFRAEWLGLILAALLGGAGVFAFRNRRMREGAETPGEISETPGEIADTPTRDGVILAIAQLDEAFQAEEAPSEEARNWYHARRKALLDQLKRYS